MDVIALADEAEVARGTAYRIFDDAPGVQEKSYAKLERALDRIEFEHGHGIQPIGEPGQKLVEFLVEGNFGVRAVVKGPISDIEALRKAASDLIAGMGRESAKEQNP